MELPVKKTKYSKTNPNQDTSIKWKTISTDEENIWIQKDDTKQKKYEGFPPTLSDGRDCVYSEQVLCAVTPDISLVQCNTNKCCPNGVWLWIPKYKNSTQSSGSDFI